MTSKRIGDESIGGPTDERLTELLERRAGRLDVHPDIDDVFQRTDSADTAPRPQLNATMRSVLAAAAVIVIGLVGVVAVSSIARGDEELATLDGEFAIQEAVSEAMTADGGETAVPQTGQVIVWLAVGVSEPNVAMVADRLDQHSAVDSYRYVDQVETYVEFIEYFADQPEIIDLVEPEQLPTSFVVTTRDAMALAAALEPIPWVDAVETADESPQGPGGG